jgi:hypothetical protein
MRQKAEIWQTYIDGPSKPKGKIQNPEYFALWGRKCRMKSNA